MFFAFGALDPIAFEIGSFSARWYGVILAVAFLCGYFLVRKICEEKEKEIVSDIFLNSLVFGFLGARIYHVFLHFDFYIQDLLQIFAVWNGGLAIHGAILGVLASVLFFSKKKNIDFWRIADLFSIPAALGQGIGRWGNYFNQELFGGPSRGFLGVFIEKQNRPEPYSHVEYFEPVFLYESILNFLSFIFLFILFRSKKLPQGSVFLIYILNYSLIRLAMEFIRGESGTEIFGFRVAFWMSLILIFTSLLTFLVKILKKKAV